MSRRHCLAANVPIFFFQKNFVFWNESSKNCDRNISGPLPLSIPASIHMLFCEPSCHVSIDTYSVWNERMLFKLCPPPFFWRAHTLQALCRLNILSLPFSFYIAEAQRIRAHLCICFLLFLPQQHDLRSLNQLGMNRQQSKHIYPDDVNIALSEKLLLLVALAGRAHTCAEHSCSTATSLALTDDSVRVSIMAAVL